MSREGSTSRARAAREGELLERWRRVADLLHEAPAKFKVMRWRVVQHSLRPLTRLSPDCISPAAGHAACPSQPHAPCLKRDLVYGEDLGSARAGSGLAGASGVLLKVVLKEQLHCFSQTILSRWEN